MANLVLAGCASARPPAMGMMGGSSVYHYSTVSCSAPAQRAGARITVVLADMGMTRMMGGTAPLGAHMMLRAAPAIVPAGPVTLVASNSGWRTHELVILPLEGAATAGQRKPEADGKVDEVASLGEASNSCGAGAGDGISAGNASWTTVTLVPGRYELICNLPNHYADGMHQEITVI